MRARITGTGSYMPEKILTTGIEERRIAADDECTSDMAVIAAERAMEMAGVKADQIDLIIVGTITGDYPWPATACIVQAKIGAKKAFAYDVSAACSGFLYALSCANDFIRSGHGTKALVIGAETLSRSIDWTDRNTCVLFGDGAGAVVVEAGADDAGILSCHLHSDGNYLELLYQPGFGAKHPASTAGVDSRLQFLKMQGNEVFKVAVRSLTEVSIEALEANGFTHEDVTLFVPHQANRRILEATAKRLHYKYGNTSGATIPVALDEANRQGLLSPGDLVLSAAFGGGFTWASTLLRWA